MAKHDPDSDSNLMFFLAMIPLVLERSARVVGGQAHRKRWDSLHGKIVLVKHLDYAIFCVPRSRYDPKNMYFNH